MVGRGDSALSPLEFLAVAALVIVLAMVVTAALIGVTALLVFIVYNKGIAPLTGWHHMSMWSAFYISCGLVFLCGLLRR